MSYRTFFAENQQKMAAQCMGNFGMYKMFYPQYLDKQWNEYKALEAKSQDQDDKDIRGFSPDTVWVNKRYIPTDLRSTAPVARHKLIAPRCLPPSKKEWIPIGEASVRDFSRAREETDIHASSPSTRCEEWSTLRQLLPSRGRSLTHSPPNWGTGAAYPPDMLGRKQTRFPHLNSPMTR